MNLLFLAGGVGELSSRVQLVLQLQGGEEIKSVNNKTTRRKF